MILAPGVLIPMMGFPLQDPVIFGIVGSVYVAFGLLSILGLRAPLKFVSILLLQLSYKVIWFVITSYSIHYTKLYELNRRHRYLIFRESKAKR